MSTGDQIRAARERKGWTQQQLADALDVSRGTVRNWEAGTQPRNATSRIEQVLDIQLRGDVGPVQDDADGVLLDLPDDALEGLDELQREEVKAAARLAALKTAREIRGR